MKTVAYKMYAFLVALGVSTCALADSKPHHGPQIRVAVAQFGATDRFAAEYGGWNIGGGLAAQLVTSLIDTGRVVVVERAILSKVLMEQELGSARLSSSMTKVQSGQLLGVDYLIVGEVTEFDERQMAGGSAIGVMAGIGPKVSTDVSAAHVGMDIRIIDTRTGEILHSHRAEGKAWGKAMGVKFKTGVVDFGGELFYKTPLGKATRRSIQNAVDFVLSAAEKQMKDFSWLARVIDVDQGVVYFDAGKLSNVRVGDRIRVVGVDKMLTDPETNEILGLVENDLGVAQTELVELKYSRARIIGNFQPRVGDIVRFESEHRIDEPSVATNVRGYQVLR